MFRIVTKDWEVIELLTRCGLHRSKLKKNQLSIHIINAIITRTTLELKSCISTHQNRARLNKGVIDEVKRKLLEASPAENHFCTHAINNSGKKSIGGKGVSKYAYLFRKSWQSVINAPVKQEIYMHIYLVLNRQMIVLCDSLFVMRNFLNYLKPHLSAL